VLLGHGSTDHWYTDEKFAADERRLAEAGVAVERCAFTGGHEWSAAFSARATTFLRELQA
jgi:predicted esterase